MNAKILKLKFQVHGDVQKKSKIFNGISIYVNGYTSLFLILIILPMFRAIKFCLGE